MNLTSLHHRYAANASARLIQVGLDGTRREISHAELAQHVRARADELTAAGIKPGHVIGLKAANSIDWAIWDLVAIETGALLYALPDQAPLPDPARLLTDAGLSILATDTAGSDPAGVQQGIHDPLRKEAVHCGAPRKEDADLHSLVFSSGTSGSLKGLLISRRGTECVISRFIDAFAVTGRDRHLIFLPLWNYQQRLSLYCCLWVGIDLVLAPFQRVFSALASERPTFVIGPPVFFESALHLHRKSGQELSLGDFLGGQIRFMITGMAPIRRATLDAFWDAGVPLLEAYGMTETGMIAWNTPSACRVGTVGRLIDPPATEFTADSELMINASAPLSLGYFQAADGQPGETFRPDGTIVTGDFGRLDADGFLTLLGRRKDVITLGSGQKVNPTEIEAQFADAPDVLEIVVVTTGDSGRLGAVVALPPAASAEAATRAQAQVAEINARSDPRHRVSRFVFVDHPIHSEPRFQTANMKLRRSAVADYFSELLASPPEHPRSGK